MRLCHVLRNAVHLIHDLLAAWLFCSPNRLSLFLDNCPYWGKEAVFVFSFWIWKVPRVLDTTDLLVYHFYCLQAASSLLWAR